MYCPKCGLQNSENPKFCRACGADIRNVLAVIDGALSELDPIHGKIIELRTLAFKKFLVGIGFLVVSAFAYQTPRGMGVLWLFMLVPAFIYFASSMSQLFHLNSIKQMIKPDVSKPILPEGGQDYLAPELSIEPDGDFGKHLDSVTDHTTRQLRTKN